MSNMDVQEMQTRIHELEAENARLRAENSVLRGNQTREQLHMSPLALRPAEPRPPSPLALPPAESRPPSPVASPRPAGLGSLRPTAFAMEAARRRHRRRRLNKIRANVEDAVNSFVLQESTTQNDANEWIAAQLNANQDRRQRWLTELRSVLDERLSTDIANPFTEQVLRRLLTACDNAQAESPPLRPANAANMLWRKAVRL